jgi:hypothetical protein
MTQKIAIAVIHGIGKARPEFAEVGHPDFLSGIAPRLRQAFANELGDRVSDAGSELVFEPVYWADVVQRPQDDLYTRLGINQFSQFFGLRGFIFHSLADSVAYQPTSSSGNDPQIYEGIHRIFANSLKILADNAGKKAPLCIIAHSMGAAIASNFIWDAQKNRFSADTRDNPLELGQTFSSFYTFGSQVPFWAMRFSNFGEPIQVPSPQLSVHYPEAKGEWINFFDRDDLLGYPIKNINDHYRAAVTDEQEVSVGNWLTGWNTLSHNGYWKSRQVTRSIGASLARLWRQTNPA